MWVINDDFWPREDLLAECGENMQHCIEIISFDSSFHGPTSFAGPEVSQTEIIVYQSVRSHQQQNDCCLLSESKWNIVRCVYPTQANRRIVFDSMFVWDSLGQFSLFVSSFFFLQK